MASINNIILNYMATEGDYLEITVLNEITMNENGANIIFSYKEHYPNTTFYSDSGEVEISMTIDDLIKLQSKINKYLEGVNND